MTTGVLPNGPGQAQPPTFLLTKQRHCKLLPWKFPSVATRWQKRTSLGKLATTCQQKAFVHVIITLFGIFHECTSEGLIIHCVFFSGSSILGTGISGLYSIWDSGINSSRGRCSLGWHQAAGRSNSLCVNWERNTFIKHFLQARVCII